MLGLSAIKPAKVAPILERNLFLDEGTVTLAQIEREATRLAERLAPIPLTAILIDHAGLIRPERSAAAYERASAAAIGLKQLARSLNTAVHCIVQANRGGKSERDPVPLEAARDSGCFEENADFVLAFSGLVEPKDQPPFVKVKLAKNRRGPTPSTLFVFDPHTLRMTAAGHEGASA